MLAQHLKNIQDGAQVLADANGHYRVVLPDGRYNIFAEAKDRAGAAITDRSCRAGESLELPSLELTVGGWIEGQVLNTRTNQPVVTTDRGLRITIGLFGPANPARLGIISPEARAVVDEQGRFKLRAAAGENFPYLVNERGQRMAWDTLKQPAVVVHEGETTHYDMLITPEATPEEKMQAARKILAQLPADREQRVAGIIDEFRKLNHTVDETEVWCLLMRELVTIGGDAVPQLCEELDQTDEQRHHPPPRVRAAGDQRLPLVPVLIRSIPKTLQPPMSDYGLTVADADLMAFMQQHQLEHAGRGQYFNFGRPVRKVYAPCTTSRARTWRTRPSSA